MPVAIFPERDLGAAHASKNPIVLYQEMWLQRWLRVSKLLSAATSQQFNWSGPRPGT